MFERPEWLKAAAKAFDFVLRHMEKDGRLTHSWRAGQAKVQGNASDYANMIWAALRLLQATNEAAFLAAAERWCATLDRHFWVADGGGYAFTADDTPDVIVRMRGAHDDATPNANAIMISNLVALNLLTGKPAYLERAHAIPAGLRRRPRQQLAGTLRPARGLLRPDRPAAGRGDRVPERGYIPNLADARHVPAVAARRGAAGRRPRHAGSHRRPARRQDRRWRPAHRLRLPRPAMLAARDGAGRAARSAARQRTAPAV